MKKKNKKEEQKLKREKLKQERLAAKRKKRGISISFSRAKPSKEQKQKILIVCEGENTEPSYFNQFKLTKADIKAIGQGYNTISLVNKAIEFAQKEKYDRVWCVFDKDDFKENDFNNAIWKAKGKKFGIAYSNQAFEYWLLLHFEDHQGGAMSRKDYYQKLNGYLATFGANYDKNSKKVTTAIFDILQAKVNSSDKTRQNIACQRAKKIYIEHQNNGRTPAKSESSTTVFQLIQEIEKYR